MRDEADGRRSAGALPQPPRPSRDALARDELDRAVSALRDPTRRGILLALVRDTQARTVDEVAGLAGVHRTVAFGHLERLVDLGFLTKSRRRSRPGKPAALYAPSEGALSLQYPARQFVMLAGLLASALDTLGDAGQDMARGVGRQFGERVATRRAASLAEAIGPLEFLGAEHSVEGQRIVARNCVFLEACASSPSVVCALHAGLLEGALNGAGIGGRVDCRGALPPAACAFELVPTPR